MKTFIVTLLFVLVLEACLFVSLGAEHLVYALLSSICISECIKFENIFIAKEMKKNIQSGQKHISKIIPIITKEVKVLKNSTIKQGVAS